MSIFKYTTQSTMAVIEVDCINGLPICIKTCGFYSIILGRLKLNLTVCNKILMIN